MKRLIDKDYIVKSGEVLVGSSLLKSKKLKPKDKLKYMLNNMEFNKVFIYKKTKSIIQNREILKKLKKSFKDYRQKWNEQPKKIINEKIPNSNFKNQKLNPLCVDIEVASICDLACPFCFREHEVTPDKIIDEKF